MNNPLVTVYVTNHNYGRYLKRAVDSLLIQSLQDFELIVIDDGSTDDSRQVIESYYSGHPKINIIYQQNKGLNVTNNIALRVARGTYIMRLDADDYLDENALLLMSNKLEEDKGLGLIFPDYFLVDADENILGLERRHTFEKDVSMLDQPAHGACTMIRRDFLLEVGGYDESFSCQDGYDLWLKFTAKYRVANINLPLFYYRQHGANLTRNEDRLLTTRAAMKELHANENHPALPTIAILPVRGTKTSQGNLAMQPLGDKRVIDWLIEEALQSKAIDMLVVTTSDEAIRNHVEEKYQNNPRFLYQQRPSQQARLNVGLSETVQFILDQPAVTELQPQAIMLLSIEFPFVTANNMTDAVNTLQIFHADSVVSVRPDSDMFFQHHGQGLQPILGMNRFTRLEREALFRHAGGLSVTRTTSFAEHQAFISGQVSHIVVSQQAAHAIRSEYDMTIARLLAARQPANETRM